MAIGECTLPFPRGNTWSDGEVTPTATAIPTHLLGRIYEVQDSVHGTGNPVRLRVVQNSSSAAITTARKLYEFGTDALDFGRKVDNVCDTAGAPCKPMDDAYAVGSTIPAYDLFYIVEEGPCYILTETSSVNLAQFGAVAADATGYVNGAVAADGEYVVGRIDAASTTTNTSVVVHVAAGIALPSEG